MITFKEVAQGFKTACTNLVTADKPHESINTFGVIEDGSALNTDNLGFRLIDTDTPYFFSRRWVEDNYPDAITWELPVCCIIRQSGVLQHPLGCKNKQGVETIKLYVLDQYTEDINNSTEASARTKEDIYEDTKALALELLSKVFKEETTNNEALRNAFAQTNNFAYNFISAYGQSNLYGIELTFNIKTYFCKC